MSEKLQLEYYYGIEAEQFSFYRVPRLLIKDARFKKLSSDAKLLYGLMLDRMLLSIKHEWVDEKNCAYIIYTIDSIKDDLGCSKEKAIKVLAELDSVKGIGLVEKIRRGLGKPDIIYVKNFASLSAEKDEKEPANPYKITEVGKSDPNYTNMSYINHINQSEKAETKDDVIDRMDDHIQEYIELIKDNIEYDHHMKYDQENDREIYDELFQVICDVVCVKRETVKIAGEDYPYALVQSQFLKLKGSHLEYVIFCMKKTTTKITNIKAYMITALYNAPATLDQIVLQDRKDKEIIGNERQCLKVSYECYQRLITGKQRCVFVRDDSYRETEVIEIYAADPSGYNTKAMLFTITYINEQESGMENGYSLLNLELIKDSVEE